MGDFPEPDGRPRPSGLMSIQDVGLQEVTLQPLGHGDLAGGGTQFGTPGTAPDSNVYATVGLSTASAPGVGGQLLELEFGLMAALRQDSTATSTLSWKWQARSAGRSKAWVDLHAADSSVMAAEATAWFDDERVGLINIQDDLDRLPVEIQLLYKSSNQNDDGVAKIDSASFVRAVTSSLYRRASD